MTHNSIAGVCLCLALISTGCTSLSDSCPPPLPSKPEVIKVSEPLATPCPRTIPDFVIPPGASSDEVDRLHQKYIREQLFPVLRCFITATPEK